MAPLTTVDQSTQFDTLDKALGNNKLGRNERGGHVKAIAFTYTNDSGSALADGSIVKLAKVSNCVILPTSFVHTSAFGASRTLDMGVQEYTDYNGAVVASDIDALIDGLDVSSAVAHKVFGTDTASLTAPTGLAVTGQADILGKVIGGTLPTNGTIKGILFVISA